MGIVLDVKEIPYDRHLTLDALEKHANGYLRYQNFSDLVAQGPAAVQAYINRANQLFRKNLTREFPKEADQIGDLDLSYMTIFFRDEKEAQDKALPMTDFLKFRFKDHGEDKSGFGIFFSSYGRELDRNKMESGQLDNIDASAAVYYAMFKDMFPQTGVIEGRPIMTMRQAKAGNTNDVVAKYYGLLGTTLDTIRPEGCPAELRCFHHGEWSDIDPKVQLAAISLGQAMQEFIRIDEYRKPGDPETESLPRFDWNTHGQVKGNQAELAQKWFADHAEGIKDLVDRYKNQQGTVEAPAQVGTVTGAEHSIQVEQNRAAI